MQIIQQHFTVSYSYPVLFTRSVFQTGNPTLRDLFLSQSRDDRKRTLVVVDSGVSASNPTLLQSISRYAESHADVFEIVAPPLVVRGGEACKQDSLEVEKIHALVERHRLCRHSYLLAIGGGAVLDAAGFAAATAHRGVRLIRFPSTVLAQNDAGVGVKNGINAFGRKNFLGTFAPPSAVVNDFDFLKTLGPRDSRGGIGEAIKVALINDRRFFDDLYRDRHALALFEPCCMERMIVRCAELHLEHIAGYGDPFESGSSRPLDFGHWSAHKLEDLTHGELRHGEAVAIGMTLDCLYSREIGSLGELDLHRILTLLDSVGFDLYHPALSWLDVSQALDEFREHLGGELSIPLLSGIGQKVEAHDIDPALMRKCIAKLALRATGKPEVAAPQGQQRQQKELPRPTGG